VAVLKDIHIDGALRDDMVDVNLFRLAIASTSGNGLCHSGVKIVLSLRQQRRDEDDVIGVGEIPDRY